MFETVQKDYPITIGLTLRGFYLTVVSALAICAFLIDLFPGTARDEIRYRGIKGLGGLALMASMALAAPLIPYLFWRIFVKREVPIFWGISFLIAVILMFLFGIITS